MQNSVRDSECPGIFASHKNATFLTTGTTIFTFIRWEQISAGLEHPPSSHKQDGVGEEEEDVENSDCGVRTTITENEERISQGK